MTPEERAVQIADHIIPLRWDDKYAGAVERIAAAIRAAVEEEREACAAIAEEYSCGYSLDGRPCDVGPLAAREIRARQPTSSPPLPASAGS